MDFYLKIRLLSPNATIPTRAYDSAGYDLFPLNDGKIAPNEWKMIQLGFSTEFTPGYVAQIDDRGSIGNKGLGHLAGVIDSDYRNEWAVMLMNFSNSYFSYTRDKAIAQVLFLKVEAPIIEVVEQLSETKRGMKYLGSSDKSK